MFFYCSPVTIHAPVLPSVMRTDHKRLADHVVALLLVTAGVTLDALVGSNNPLAALLLAGIAVVISAYLGGVSPAIVATLGAVLATRLVGQLGVVGSVLLTTEGLVIAWLAWSASTVLTTAASRMTSGAARLRQLVSAERRLRRIEAAGARLEASTTEYGVMIVDHRGDVLEWRESATRLLGWSGNAMRGQTAARVFGMGDATLQDTLVATGDADELRFVQTCHRANGTLFDADVAIYREPAPTPSVFTIIIRDKSREQQWHRLVDESHDLQSALRDEVAVAHRQLATLQHITDPSLSQLNARQVVPEMLDRLRAVLDVEGVAFISAGRPRRIVVATEALEPQDVTDRWPPDYRPSQDDRILVIHNDPACVEAVSGAKWPSEVSSLIVVPVVLGSRVEGTIEVVGVRPRRSTEWEIAVVQVVAAQVAARLQTDNLVNADAVA
jgi:GAF domain-containing protein